MKIPISRFRKFPHPTELCQACSCVPLQTNSTEFFSKKNHRRKTTRYRWKDAREPPIVKCFKFALIRQPPLISRAFLAAFECVLNSSQISSSVRQVPEHFEGLRFKIRLSLDWISKISHPNFGVPPNRQMNDLESSTSDRLCDWLDNNRWCQFDFRRPKRHF